MLLLEALRQKIQTIRRIGEVTDWLSGASFVVKPLGGLRLVTDLVHLNRAVQCPTHSFQPVNDILSLIEPGLKTSSPPLVRTRSSDAEDEDDLLAELNLDSPSLMPAMIPTWKRSGPEAGTLASAWSRLLLSVFRRFFLI